MKRTTDLKSYKPSGSVLTLIADSSSDKIPSMTELPLISRIANEVSD